MTGRWPFDRFAAQRIRGAILDAVRAPTGRRAGPHPGPQARGRRAAATELGRVPSLKEMATSWGSPWPSCRAAGPAVPARSSWPSSTRSPTTWDEDLTLVDVLVDRTAVGPLEELETREAARLPA